MKRESPSAALSTAGASVALVPVVDPSAAALAHLEPLVERARAFVAGDKAASTRRAYRAGWNAFEAWCHGKSLPARPASPATVAIYLAHLADAGQAYSTIKKALAAIADAHRKAGATWPKGGASPIPETMAGIVRAIGAASVQKAPIRVPELRAMVRTLRPAQGGAWALRALRDRALLTLGWSGIFRRSELVSLRVSDIRRVREGLNATLRRSKTDQRGEGYTKGLPFTNDPELCPARSLDAWLAAAKITKGYIFRGVNRHDQVSARGLSDKTVARVVKRAALRAGLDPEIYSGHSVRAGGATAAAEAGKGLGALMQQGGWKSEGMALRYVRHGSLYTDNAMQGIV